MNGWIKLDRSISDHWLWQGESFTQGQAWIDLIMNANFKPSSIKIKGTIIHLDPGQQARSEVSLSKAWGWSRGKVRRFLKLLEKEKMIEQQSGHLTSIITICNYSRFQFGDTAGGTGVDTSVGTAGGQEAVHSIRKKEVKKEKKVAKRFAPPTIGEVVSYCSEKGYSSLDAQPFVDYYASIGWMVGKNKMKDWKRALSGWCGKDYSHTAKQKLNQTTAEQTAPDFTAAIQQSIMGNG